jgi:hypothetical protein
MAKKPSETLFKSAAYYRYPASTPTVSSTSCRNPARMHANPARMHANPTRMHANSATICRNPATWKKPLFFSKFKVITNKPSWLSKTTITEKEIMNANPLCIPNPKIDTLLLHIQISVSKTLSDKIIKKGEFFHG